MAEEFTKFDGTPELIGEPDIAPSLEAAGADAIVEETLPPLAIPVPCEDISGIAGSGKTYYVREKIREDSSWGLLCATTGVAAINLGTITLNSALGFFDTDSLRDAYLTGRLSRKLHQIGLDHRRLVIDERSMLDAEQLDLLYRAASEANEYRDLRDRPLGITLVGDFAQLPPVRARFCFDAECWPEFSRNTLRLTKVWRQEQSHFLEALNATRRGDGHAAADILSAWGTEWHTSLDTHFDGTTIVPKNDQVDRYNSIALDRVSGPKLTITSRRWGKASAEWRNVPERTELKLNAYVMILANSPLTDGEFIYVNGDCGHIREVTRDAISIELVRNGRVISLPRLVRSASVKDKPEGWYSTDRSLGYLPRPHRNSKGWYVLGQVEYFPVRLAYASTVHKSQGVSLDRLQVDVRDQFFSAYGMCYVALSRVRTIEGLRMVGQKERFIKNCRVDPRVEEWL